MLTLRLISKNDFPLYQALYQNKDVMKFVCPPLSDAACERSFDLLINKIATQSNRLAYVIECSDSQQALGLIDAKSKDDDPWVEVGVLLFPNFQGKSNASGSHRLLFKKLVDLNWPACWRAYCHKDNVASQHLYQALGFIQIKGQSFKDNKTTAWEKK